MPTTLEAILESTRRSLPALRARADALYREAAASPEPPPLLARWNTTLLGLIAEVKRRSPSAGEIRGDLDPVGHAAAYARAGACAVSVLTDGPYFGGSLDDLAAVAGAVSVPVLRKDFILDPLQIAEARVAGASAVLLIVRALGAERLAPLLRAADDWGLDALVEVHDPRELELALEAGARVVGVNSRNLDDFTIDVEAAWSLVGRVPASVVAVAESGMRDETDVRRAAVAGADLVLVGTALSSAPDPSELAANCAVIPRLGR
jgi:indole-3-glycerol phosphate synthase